LVRSVDGKSGLVTVSIGSDAALKKGHKLDVYRLKPAPMYLGQIEIIDVAATQAVGKPLGKAKDAIQEGDSVSSGLLDRAEEKWGTVKGQITWDDKKPPPGSENVVVNAKNKGLKNVIVWLTDADDAKKALPINPALKAGKDVTLTIQGAGPVRRFEPRVLAVREGQTVVIANGLRAAEKVRWITKDNNPGDSKPLPAGKKIDIDDLKVSRRGIVVVSDLTPSLRAYMWVFDHPYFAVTDADGNFEIKGAPAGKYNIVMWQEEAGWVKGGKRGQTITIPAGKTVEVNEKAKAAE
jgi:hypothetical protein